MCGRFYVNDETVKEVQKVIQKTEENIVIKYGDMHPSDLACIIKGEENGLTAVLSYWGFPGFKRGSIIFNARCETVMEKKLFREHIRQRRCLIPAACFYEWDRKKEKVTFYRKGVPVLYMAGFYGFIQDKVRFIILTTNGNDSIRPVHDRMPLILEENEQMEWLYSEEEYQRILYKTPCALENKREYEQQSLFF